MTGAAAGAPPRRRTFFSDVSSLAILDVETTGPRVESDAVVQYAVCRFDITGLSSRVSGLVDPGMPITPEASSVHGITDADVKGKPTFSEVAPTIDALVSEPDGSPSLVVTYNGRHFDLPLLARLYAEARQPWTCPLHLDVFDVVSWFFRGLAKGGRKLSNLVTALGLMPLVESRLGAAKAHDASGDCLYTAALLWHLQKVGLVPRVYRDAAAVVAKLGAALDAERRAFAYFIYVRADGVLRFGFGDDCGKPVTSNPSFCRWALKRCAGIPAPARSILSACAAGSFEQPPPGSQEHAAWLGSMSLQWTAAPPPQWLRAAA